ncbi:hypothetical protein ACFO4E_07610 [Nocardiopsis mangrovi]|uniref:Uncharacterized protein n=1 Tax=Nocardiopsis mangrovi TaxID=1179818 RepID=A0ABV9DUS4_9ACTN
MTRKRAALASGAVLLSPGLSASAFAADIDTTGGGRVAGVGDIWG